MKTSLFPKLPALVSLALLCAIWADGAAQASEESLAIRLNSVGYLPHSRKQASIASPCAEFAVVRVADEKTVFAGKAGGPAVNHDTQETLYTADFSTVTEPGEYRLEIPSLGRSVSFHVAPDVYHAPFSTVMRAFYLWRCGTAVSATVDGRTFAHSLCHTNDGWLDFVGGGHERKDASKGWHDAGDYNKYIVNAGLTVGTMFRAWEDFGADIKKVKVGLPDSDGKLPEFLAEQKWEMDWVLTMQAPDGSVYHKLSTTNFCGFIPAEAEKTARYFTPWGSEATADFVGMAAQAARVFKPYDRKFAARCLQAAQLSYKFLQAHPEYHKADQAAFTTGAYEVNEPDRRLSGIPNNRIWAAAELWETTGSREVLSDLETRIRTTHGHISPDFDWEEVKELGLITYLASHRSGRDSELLALVSSNLLAAADGIVQASRQHGYARPLGEIYYWGCNGGVARQTMILMAADRLACASRSPSGAGPTEYRAVCLDALNHLFGRNPYSRSFVTGVGARPPLHPHDRRCGVDSGASSWPGYLVGGAHPHAVDWKDRQAEFRTNEIAINWNAALVYALAACLNE